MSAPTQETLAFAVHGPITRDDLPGLCSRACTLFASSSPGVALCDVRTVEPDAVTVDALSRLQLAAKRRGYEVHLRNASGELLELVAFMGLENVLGE